MQVIRTRQKQCLPCLSAVKRKIILYQRSFSLHTYFCRNNHISAGDTYKTHISSIHFACKHQRATFKHEHKSLNLKENNDKTCFTLLMFIFKVNDRHHHIVPCVEQYSYNNKYIIHQQRNDVQALITLKQALAVFTLSYNSS